MKAFKIAQIAGYVSTSGVYLAPIWTMYCILTTQNIDMYRSHFYLAAIINCAMWMLHTSPAVIPDKALFVINSVGLGLIIPYLSPFLYFGNFYLRRNIALCLVGEGIVTTAISMIALHLFEHDQNRTYFVATCCCLASAVMYCSPIATVMMVIHNKNVEGMSILPPLVGWANTIVLLIYSLLVPKRDWFILASSIVGIASSVVQIMVYVYYKHVYDPNQADRAGDGHE